MVQNAGSHDMAQNAGPHDMAQNAGPHDMVQELRKQGPTRHGSECSYAPTTTNISRVQGLCDYAFTMIPSWICGQPYRCTVILYDSHRLTMPN